MMTRRLAWATVAAIALATSLPSCGLHGKPRVARKSDLGSGSVVEPVATRSVTSAGKTTAEEVPGASVVAPGIVEPWGGQVDLSAHESGWIARIIVKEGDIVQEGQLLATLDDEAQRHSVELARAEVAEAEATLLKMERGASSEELRQVQADYEAAAARAGFSRGAAARTSRLHANGTVPDNEADRATAEADAQTAAAERAAARLQEVRRGAEAEDRSAARARLAAARARLGLAEASLAHRHVSAPSAGAVLLSRFHPGEFYNPGAGPLFVLGEVSRLQVRLEVDEIDVSDVRIGAPCALVSDGGRSLGQGTVVRVAPKMGRRALPLESPTARADVRIREVFVEIPATAPVVPGQRVWGHTARANLRTRP